ncbi:MAG TPA: dienelactone hydrolase family protein [Rectinemataceae bacterium]|nr:dienelactone hydrolase family protein [Rectinemataceae bacterium]
MGVKTEWIRYGTGSGLFALPDHAATPLPAVLVISEIWGVEEHIEDVTRRIAMSGYAALAPDLFAENGQRLPQLTRERIAEFQAFMARLPPSSWGDQASREAEMQKLPPAERGRVGETFSSLFGMSPERRESFAAPLREAVRHLKHERPETKGQGVACVGFCMGGGLSALLACEEPELDGAAVYYGNTPSPERLARIACPVIAFYGGLDARVNAGIPAFEEGMRKAGKAYEHHVYDDAPHAFFNDTRPTYRVAAARDSFARLLAFFGKVLVGS